MTVASNPALGDSSGKVNTPQPTLFDLCERGYSLIPCGSDKRPLLPSWKPYQSRRPTAEEVKKWEKVLHPQCWAVVTGEVSGVLVLDFDGNGGAGTLARLRLLPHVRTGSGGSHVYFQHPGWRVPTVNAKSKRALGQRYPGTDIRADGGYAVCLGRNRKGAYRWLRSVQPDQLDILPPKLRALLGLTDASVSGPAAPVNAAIGTKSTLGATAAALIEKALNDAPPRGRNAAGFELACSLRDRGCSRREAENAMLEYAARVPGTNQHGEPEQYTVREALASVSQAYTRPPRGPVLVSPPSGEGSLEHLTDSGNARRIVNMYADKTRYCAGAGGWLIYSGKSWAQDKTGEAVRLAQEALKAIYFEAESVVDADKRAKHLAWAKTSEGQGKIQAALTLAESQRELRITPDQLDRDPWLFNCPNGTLDLRTGELRGHRREDYITKLSGTDYEPHAQHKLWDEFLDRVLAGDADLKAYLQRAVGYSLTGSTREQKLFMLYGTGNNGKTTFLETVRGVLGAYATNADFSTFALRERSGASGDLARLAGSRFVTSVEPEKGEKLSLSRTKQVTGGDRVTARHLFQPEFEFTPQFKLWLAVNDKPHVGCVGPAIWRRIQAVPFTVTIPKPEIKADLPERLAAEYSGILWWAVEGCLLWREPGLKAPLVIEQATEGYRQESDVLADFITDRCDLDPKALTPINDLYAAYTQWCEENHERPRAKNTFGGLLEERGYHPDRDGKERTRVRQGIKLKPRQGELAEYEN